MRLASFLDTELCFDGGAARPAKRKMRLAAAV
jgi:hypothetical protein